MDGVGTSILGRPRRLSRDRRATPDYTLIWEEPVIVAVALDQICEVYGEDRCTKVHLIGLFFRVEDGTHHVLRDYHFVDFTDADMVRARSSQLPAPT